MTLVRQKTIKEDGASTSEVLRIYRHYDGYPEGHGLDIANACMMADQHHDMNNRNWAQPFLASLLATYDTDMEVVSDREEYYVSYIYTVTGIRDVSGGKCDVEKYDLQIGVYEFDPSKRYDEITKGRPLFTGGWREYLGKYSNQTPVERSPMSKKTCGATLGTCLDGREVLMFNGACSVETIEIGRDTSVDEILLAIEKVGVVRK